MNSLKIRFLLLTLPFFFVIANCRSQTQAPVRDTLSGTYQIQVVNSRNEPFIPGNINQLVIEHRKENETVYYPIDNVVRIKILSRKEITSAGFQPIKQIEHVSE